MRDPVIDVHAHIIVPESTRDAAAEGTWRPQVRWEQDRQIVEFAGTRITSAVREFTDIEGLLRAEYEGGVDHVLLCPWVPLLRYDADPDEGLRICRLQNAALSALAQRFPDRIHALGAVPLQNPALAAREVATVMRLPGLAGVEIAASVRGTYLGDGRFRLFWEAAEAAGAVVFIHPTTRGFDHPVLADHYLWNTVGNPLETTITAAQMIMAGVLETFPKLKVILAHGGGALVSLRGRLRHAHRIQPQARARLRGSPDESMRRLYFDTVVHDPDVLRALVEYAGPDHVLLGSDYPFDMGLARPVDAVRALSLAPDAEARILGGNAAQLIGMQGGEGRA